MTHLHQPTAALYPVNRRHDGTRHGRDDATSGCTSHVDDDNNNACGNRGCSAPDGANVDDNREYNDDGNYDSASNSDDGNSDIDGGYGDSDGDDGGYDGNDDDVIPAGSVDVLYSSHTLEHVSHFHSDKDHDRYFHHNNDDNNNLNR